MTSCRRQALIDAPVEEIWDLVGNPKRHPDWWPRVIEVNGERFDSGDRYVQVSRGPFGNGETEFLVERKDDMREIKLRCQLTGTYADWQLTEAQGGTFVNLEMGIDPRGIGRKVFDATFAPRFFRRWADQSIEGLQEAAGSDAPEGGSESVGSREGD
jgi:hypothetical protein